MLNAIIKQVSEVTGKSITELEDLWKQAVEISKKEYNKKDYAIIMGIFKKSLGEDILKKMKWEESCKTFKEFLSTREKF